MKKVIAILIFFVFASDPGFAQQSGFNVDILPTNIGGKAEFKRMFEQALIYPATSLRKKIGGSVTINFAVMKDSSVTNVKINKPGVADLDSEAMRLFKLYQWVPAVRKEEYISANWSVTVDFDPQQYHKICEKRGFVNFSYLKEFKIDTTGNNQYFSKWEVDSTGKVYPSSEVLPTYPKGNYALQDFIKTNLEYPHAAQAANIQGAVLVRFVVEPNGLVTNIGIEKSIGGGCDQEAIRVLEMMLKWHPGRNGNKLVRVQMAIPFYFNLNNEFKDNSFGEQR